MKLYKYPNQSQFEELSKRPVLDFSDLEEVISPVFKEVEKYGDEALKRYTKFYDRVELCTIEVTKSELREAKNLISEELKNAINIAAENIQKFHSSESYNASKINTSEGVECWRKYTAIQKVGLYIPGGNANLFSSVLMLGIPAKIAGCQEIIICTPPNKQGKIAPAVLYAANLIGITKIYKVGGIQSIAAMSLGTETIPKLSKVFGPGNQFVTAAKQYALRYGMAIDMPAGPSEVLVFADSTANASFIAADLLSQAEHGDDSQVVFLTTDKNLIDKVNNELKTQLQKLPRLEIAQKALRNSKSILVNTIEDAIMFINTYAPEHLIISAKEEDQIADEILNAGSVFIGSYTPESAGDYASGTNHTLPTNGFAKSYSGVTTLSYMKQVSFQKISKDGLKKIGQSIEIMADAEGLQAHKNAVSIRLSTLNAEYNEY